MVLKLPLEWSSRTLNPLIGIMSCLAGIHGKIGGRAGCVLLLGCCCECGVEVVRFCGAGVLFAVCCVWIAV